MSHIPERKEKNCLNCGTTVYGRYCHICGQENIVPKESFWHMVLHFFSDITHFDSKFFGTVKQLFLHPGFLSAEYIKGRRAAYLHPVRMYVFTSAIFFLIFFSFFKPKQSIDQGVNLPLSLEDRKEYVELLEKKITTDTANKELKKKLQCAKDTSCVVLVKDLLAESSDEFSFSIGDNKYTTVEAYDSVQRQLPKSEKDGWFMYRLNKKAIELGARFKNDSHKATIEFTENVLHHLPYLLFISLPLFALLLKLVYVRRKQFYFMDHAVFTIHFYIFCFLVLLVIFGLNALGNAFSWSFMGWIIFLLYCWIFFYMYKAMRNFYKQGRFKTILKFCIVGVSSLILMILLFVFFAIFSIFTF